MCDHEKSDRRDRSVVVIVNLINIGGIPKPIKKLLKSIWSSVKRKT